MSSDFKINVSVIIFDSKKNILIQKRSALEDVFPGHWGVPGGGVETSDTDLISALHREVREEVGIEINNVHLFKESIVIKESSNVKYVLYIATHLSGLAQPLDDTDEVRWAGLDEMSGLLFTPTTLQSIKEAYDDIVFTNQAPPASQKR